MANLAFAFGWRTALVPLPEDESVLGGDLSVARMQVIRRESASAAAVCQADSCEISGLGSLRTHYHLVVISNNAGRGDLGELLLPLRSGGAVNGLAGRL